MPKKTITYLKSRFMAFMKPAQEDWHNVLDSYVHIDALVGLNNSTIDARIEAYDQGLRSETPGTIDTLGDVLKVLNNFPADGNIKDLLDAAGGAPSWSTVTNRPNNVKVSWTEQTLTITTFPIWSGTVESMPTISIVGSQISDPDKWLIKEIVVQSFPVAIYGTGYSWHAHRISSVVVAKNPKVDLSL